MRKTNALLLIGIIGTVTGGTMFGIQYGRAMWGRSDIWWTPRQLALPLAETRQDFELRIGDRPLQDHLQQRSLTAVAPDGQRYTVVSEDVRVRLNNWPRVRNSWLQSAVYAAFMLGASAACLVLGLVLGRADSSRR